MNLKNKISFLLIFGFFISTITLFSQNENDTIPINLEKAIEIALDESPTVRIANRTIQIKKLAKSEQITALFPDLSFVGSYNRTIKKQVMTMSFGGQQTQIEVGTDNNYSGGLSLSLPLVAPVLWQNLKLSQIEINMAIESARASKIGLIKEVKKAYYAVLLTQESYTVLKQNYDNIVLQNKIISDKYEQGVVSEFEKLRSDVQLQNQRPQLTAAENAISLSTMLLKVLLGVEITEPLKFVGNLDSLKNNMKIETLPQLQNFSLTSNSDLKQMELAINQLKTSKNLIISSACPTLVLGGNFQYLSMNNDFKFSEYNWIPYSVINFSLRIPIVSWAGTAFKIKQNNLFIANLEDQKENLEKNLSVAVQNNINNIKKSTDDLASNQETMLQAERAYVIAQKSYQLGMATWLDLSSAELAMTTAKLTYWQSIYDYLNAFAELEAITGKTN